MTIIKYGADKHIVQVSVERESDLSVWTVGGHRRAKANTYFDTWSLTHEHLLREAHYFVEMARRKLAATHAHPRLFFTLASARNALTAWLRGPLTRQEVQSGFVDCSATFSPPDYRIEVLPAKHTEAAPRSRSEMLIVPFTLTGSKP